MSEEQKKEHQVKSRHKTKEERILEMRERLGLPEPTTTSKRPDLTKEELIKIRQEGQNRLHRRVMADIRSGAFQKALERTIARNKAGNTEE